MPKGKWSDTLAASLEEKLEANWHPEQITNFSAQMSCLWSPSKPSISGFTQGGWLEVCYTFSGTKVNVKSPQKLAVNSS